MAKCFVPNKVLEELDTNQNQLLFGRRGVGKTHTLKAYLGKKTSSGELCHYFDCTALAAAPWQMGPAKNIGIRFFSKLLSHLSDALLEDAILSEKPDARLHDDLENILVRLANQAVPQSDGETFNYIELSGRPISSWIVSGRTACNPDR